MDQHMLAQLQMASLRDQAIASLRLQAALAAHRELIRYGLQVALESNDQPQLPAEQLGVEAVRLADGLLSALGIRTGRTETPPAVVAPPAADQGGAGQ